MAKAKESSRPQRGDKRDQEPVQHRVGSFRALSVRYLGDTRGAQLARHRLDGLVH
jgi:hypothetical protein